MMCAVEGCENINMEGITHDFCEKHYREWSASYLRKYRELKVE